MRFLIDECLSAALVEIASLAGHEAQHIVRIGKAGWSDWNIARYANEGNFVLVTNNGSDFRQLYASIPIHAGLVIIIPSLNRSRQCQLFQGALMELATMGEPVNRVLEVDIDGEELAFTFYDLPKP